MNFSLNNTFFKEFSFEHLRSTYPIIIKKYRFSLLLGIAGLIFFGYGLITLLSSSNSDDEIEYKPVVANQTNENKGTMVVDVSGAVVNPGVYKLSIDSRVWDGLIKAGGLSSGANREWVSKNLNLAAKLSDGGKIYIPTGQTGITSTMGSIKGENLGSVEGFIDINTASEGELDSLPGIGPVTAQKIIQNRPYSATEDLISKKVVTGKVFEKIKGKISVY
ncbi:MAG: hypothetical protein A3F31_02310 [Candidatus Levybacteria bacterium RIFCSPHIGHO2_12_FULL_38_12]|nr:MAG: hypothetical protein A2770_01245 [Candidatus Levybacteria bacterium RIFCSPHIGHO2_01_FULL_38_12]OGH22716.1 MAG: hypothetical protein A3F31_02310 [Candidatus Levybacteria bacterium RIFCSPHIGHO2_12_FULL_38_12]OGH33287.1 MAG: hypothetical protein A3A47_01445 [Candidatus Levybacteria bacterium RIFCSPLOWO2_01_FULL_37_20]OGH44855.1 MAG: hypothetical protein A3J14_02465 [Candidatus Levybacteria bacterium RIFCSPLOWO2_02_FULL_37_18]OGH51735.1 MAG: hypothetical protein A3G13_01000 [Candidatus Levy